MCKQSTCCVHWFINNDICTMLLTVAPQHLMWLHDLMLSYSTQLRKAFECLKSPQKLGCATISRNTPTGSQHLIFKSQQFFCGLCISMCIMYSQNYSKWLATYLETLTSSIINKWTAGGKGYLQLQNTISAQTGIRIIIKTCHAEF